MFVSDGMFFIDCSLDFLNISVKVFSKFLSGTPLWSINNLLRLLNLKLVYS